MPSLQVACKDILRMAYVVPCSIIVLYTKPLEFKFLRDDYQPDQPCVDCLRSHFIKVVDAEIL